MRTVTAARILCLCTLILFSVNVHGKWRPLNGGWGKDIFDVAVCGNTFFISTPAGVLRSSDCGATWTRCDSGFTPGNPSALEAGGNILYAAKRNIFRSTDYGENWTRVTSALTDSTQVHYSAFKVSGENIFLCAVDTNDRRTPQKFTTFSSTDNGVNWAEADTGLPGKMCVWLYAQTGDAAFVQGNNKISRSVDHGKSWVPVTDSVYYFSALAADENVVLAGAVDTVWRSVDKGASWKKIKLVNGDRVFSFGFVGNRIFAGTLKNTCFSTDTGKTWEVADLQLQHINFFDARGAYAIAASNSNVFISTDYGETWKESNSGLEAKYITSLATSGNNIVVGADNGIFISDNIGEGWKMTMSGWIITLAAMGNNVFAGLPKQYSYLDPSGILFHPPKGGIQASPDNGRSWSYIASSSLPTKTGSDMEPSYSYDITGIAVMDTTLFIVYNTWLYRSEDYGVNWSGVGLSKNVTAVHGYGGDTLFAGDTDGTIFRTTDNGKNWAAVHSEADGGRVRAITSNNGFVFAATDNGMFRSGKGEESWVRCDSGISDTAVTALLVYGEALVAGTGQKGVYLSIDNGFHWSDVSEDLALCYTGGRRIPVTSLTVKNNTLLAGTGSYGVWYRPLSEMLGTPVRMPQQDVFERRTHADAGAVICNGTELAIELTLSQPEQVRVKLFDMTGRVISTVVNKSLEAGTYRFSRNTRTLAQGCYLVNVQTAHTNFSKRVQTVY